MRLHFGTIQKKAPVNPSSTLKKTILVHFPVGICVRFKKSLQIVVCLNIKNAAIKSCPNLSSAVYIDFNRLAAHSMYFL